MRRNPNPNYLAVVVSLLMFFALAPGAFAHAGQKTPAAPQENNSSEIEKQLHAAQDALDQKDFRSAAQALEAVVKARDWHMYTGLMTLDGFLNGRADISLDALKHLILPVFTLGLAHWAKFGRVTRV